MQQNLEVECVLPNVTVQLATVCWEGIRNRPAFTRYSLFQRLTDDHQPLRIGNIRAPDLLPRARSVGLLPAGSPIRLLPIEKPLRLLYCFYDADFVETTTGISLERWQRHTASLVALKSKRLEILMQHELGSGLAL